MPSPEKLLLSLAAGVLAILVVPFYRHFLTLGIRRPVSSLENIYGHEIKVIPNTVQCEDVHYHADSGLLFAACEKQSPLKRYSWFPPLTIFDDPTNAGRGGLFVIDPMTFTSTELEITDGFAGSFVTHGIDVLTDPDDPNTVHIFAVNHVPNPDPWRAENYDEKAGDYKWEKVRATKIAEDEAEKSASRIELFSHVLGTKTARWRRSVRDTLIRTPNDIVAMTPNTFYVTNDHRHREGFWRQVEDVIPPALAPRTDVVFVQVTEPAFEASDPKKSQLDRGVWMFKVVRQLQNNNGLCRAGPAYPDELLITNAAGGRLYRAKKGAEYASLKIVETIQIENAIDNPSWYHDPYANATHDSSGYVLAGLPRGVDLGRDFQNPRAPIPSTVWHIRAGNRGALEKASEGHKNWEFRKVWQDTGSKIRSASAAVVVPIDPKTTGGQKQGWLFVTGFASDSMLAVRIDL